VTSLLGTGKSLTYFLHCSDTSSGKSATLAVDGAAIGQQQQQHRTAYTDKKENIIFLIYKEIQAGSGAKSYSYMTNGLLIYD
jgi:hypothetical protein